MAKDPTEFTRQTAQRAIEAANFGMDWYRELAEQNLNQSRIAVEGVLSSLRKMIGGFESQSSAVCREAISLTHESLSNTFELGQKLLRAKEPQEFAQIQSEFVSRQAQTIADKTKGLGQTILNGAEALASTSATEMSESIRGQSKAA
jgi:hypothetical protein